MLHLTLLATALLQTPTPPQKPPPQPTFAAAAAEHFACWDRDGDGTLTPLEVDLACVDPTLHGPCAAAAAAMKRALRSGKYAVPPLTRDYLTKPPAPTSKAKPAADADRADSPEGAPTGTPPTTAAPATDAKTAAPTLPPPNFAASFSRGLRRLQDTKRDLFVDQTPDLDKVHQGPLGNCYFVAAVGAFVHRDATAIQKIVQPGRGGRYDVRFGDGRSITVLPLTDAEIALSGTTGDEGLWLPVLEKALGELRQRENPAKYAMETATDAIANGGSSATIVQMLTGHKTKRITLKKQPRSTEKGPDGKPVPKPPVAAGPVDQLAAQVRKELTAAVAERRLATCGTGTEKQPPGISGKHAYAVLGFDAAADTVTLWNPHGNAFRPKGAPGLTTGYPTAGGVFTLPVAEFVQVFRGLTVETTDAVAPPKSAAAPAGKGK
jgi:hypothetical protein